MNEFTESLIKRIDEVSSVNNACLQLAYDADYESIAVSIEVADFINHMIMMAYLPMKGGQLLKDGDIISDWITLSVFQVEWDMVAEHIIKKAFKLFGPKDEEGN